MSEQKSTHEETHISALETQFLQIQNTFNQLWLKLKLSEEPVPERTVIWGREFSEQTLASATVAAAVQSRICFTYRSGFEPILRAADGPGPLAFIGSMVFNTIPNTTVAGVLDNQHFTTDVGWGCMIRTSQSLLANTLQLLNLGHDYTYHGTDARLAQIEVLFADEYKAPFSLHNFVRAASELPLQVRPGEWFGPSAASLSIKRLCDRYEPGPVPKIQVMISESCDLYDTEIEAHFSDGGAPLLVLLPIRLGIENVNVYYYPSLFQLLSLKQSVGIAGGKPSSSYYFFGFQDSQLLYLDPHNLQIVLGESSSYHTTKCRSLPISALDPSMLIGLALRDKEDYHNMREALAEANKIVHFHKGPRRHKTPAEDDYVKVTIPELEDELVDDFVNVSDQISETGSGLDEILPTTAAPGSSDSVDATISKYDVVAHDEAT